jgi:hypothetical protein
VASETKHRGLLKLVKGILEVPLGYSLDDLIAYRSMIAKQYPLLLPIIDDYISLAEKSDAGIEPQPGRQRPSRGRRPTSQMHLFDLLRDRRLFPLNSDLAKFAARVLPGMTQRRFAKISNADIAARIVEYLETLDPGTRERLEVSMKDAVVYSPRKTSEKESFFSKWERIIKKIEL